MLLDSSRYVLTLRFQSDPIEWRYSQYRQMCGGRYLVSLKDINTSEKIIRIKCLVQEGFNIDDSVKVSEEDRRESTKLVNYFEELMQRDSLPLALDAGSKEVPDHIAGYVAFKLQKLYVCQECDLVSHDVFPAPPLLSYIGFNQSIIIIISWTLPSLLCLVSWIPCMRGRTGFHSVFSTHIENIFANMCTVLYFRLCNVSSK